MKQCGTGMVRDGEQPWHWGLQSSKLLTNTELWRCKHGAGQNWFRDKENKEVVSNTQKKATYVVTLGVMWYGKQ